MQASAKRPEGKLTELVQVSLPPPLHLDPTPDSAISPSPIPHSSTFFPMPVRNASTAMGPSSHAASRDESYCALTMASQSLASPPLPPRPILLRPLSTFPSLPHFPRCQPEQATKCVGFRLKRGNRNSLTVLPLHCRRAGSFFQRQLAASSRRRCWCPTAC